MNARFVTSTLRGRNSALAALAIAAMVAATTSAHATDIAITPTPVTHNCGSSCTNSSFELGQGFGTVAGWSNASGAYNFVFSSAAGAVSPGAVSTEDSPLGAYTVPLWSVSAAPDGKAFFGLDSDYETGAVSTNLGTLAAGTYDISFYWADGQQNNYTDPSGDESWDDLTVSLSGSSTAAQTTSVVLDPSGSSTPWVEVTDVFTVSSTDTNATLSFLSDGGLCKVVSNACTTQYSTNVPAFALLDDVSYSMVTPPPQAPEPNSLLLLGTGLAGLGGLVRMRFKGAAAKA